MVAMFARAAAPVLVSRMRSSDAFASTASNVEPSWNLTPSRSVSLSVFPSALNCHADARPVLSLFAGPTSTKLE